MDKKATEKLRILRIDACQAGQCIGVQEEWVWQDMTNSFNAIFSDFHIKQSSSCPSHVGTGMHHTKSFRRERTLGAANHH